MLFRILPRDKLVKFLGLLALASAEQEALHVFPRSLRQRGVLAGEKGAQHFALAHNHQQKIVKTSQLLVELGGRNLSPAGVEYLLAVGPAEPGYVLLQEVYESSPERKVGILDGEL